MRRIVTVTCKSRRAAWRHRTAIAAIVALAAAGCSTSSKQASNSKTTENGLTVIVTPTVAGHVDQIASILESRLSHLTAPYRIEQDGESLRVDLGPTTTPPATFAYLMSTGQLLFRPLLCTSGSGTASQIVTFPPGPSANEATATTPPAYNCQLATSNAARTLPSTDQADDNPSQTVLLPPDNGSHRPDSTKPRYLLGPAQLSGNVIGTAVASPPDSISPTWYVTVTFTDVGSAEFNRMAQENYLQFIAVDVDGLVESTPQIQTQNFNGSAVINGSTFTETQVQGLASILQSGSLPVKSSEDTVDATRVVAFSGAADFVAGATGTEVDVSSPNSAAEASTLARRLAQAQIGDYEVETIGEVALVTVVGPAADQTNVLRILALNPSNDASTAAVTVLAARP